jgi:tetratricopeptide (TPR) repeat protein
MMRRLVIIAVLGTFAAGAPAEARQDDQRLDALFEQLVAGDDLEAARRVEGTIWRIWTESGSATIDELMMLGIAAMGNGQFDTALESFDAIIEAAPDFAEGWNKRATLYYLIEEYPASVRDVEATLRLEPRHFGALSGMGLIYTALEDDARALQWFERALEVNPNMPMIARRTELLRERLKGEAI